MKVGGSNCERRRLKGAVYALAMLFSLERCQRCAAHWRASASARPSSALIIPAPGSRPIVAYAHSVLATACALNVPPPL